MTNFDLAPPPKTVDGLNAVPIDISSIDATLTFDAALETAIADVTIDFIMGTYAGNPIFDLRQTITEAWLDGVSIDPAEMAHHNFGGGTDAQLRILESELPPDSTHTLRLVYSLGTPQAQLPAGRYNPQLLWNSGSRLTFNFGFTDLLPGRYLEAWLPANLIFDQFQFDMEIQILNTTVAHTPITNGTVSNLGTNHWSIAFPEYFTAFSPLLELRATDTLTSLVDILLLPVSGITVTIEFWKLASNTSNLSSLMTTAKNELSANEVDYGAYLHNNRFVIFLISGGMEYDGGTTTGVGALTHELFHSWFGRGLKPATQNDAWWDEAWTVYNMSGASSAVAFNFTNAPILLHSQNPYNRITAGGSYSDGKRFFDGLASMVGIPDLKIIMSEFYQKHNERPSTTQKLEELLLCRSGNESVVDAFYRFVYGFDNPSPAADLWIKDDLGHTGNDAWGGKFWDSPDLWVRNADDDGTVHQPPEFGQDNWLYARVRNRSTIATAAHFMVAFNVKTFAGTEFVYPNDFLPCMAAAAGFDLGPGDTAIVKAKWSKELVPPEGTHACLVASVHSRLEHPTAGTHVWEHNNLAQKNLTVVNLNAGDWVIVPFVIANYNLRLREDIVLEIVQNERKILAPFTLLHSEGIRIKGSNLKKDGNSVNHKRAIEENLLECGSDAIPGQKVPSENLNFWTSKNENLNSVQFKNYTEKAFDPCKAVKVPLDFKNRKEQQAMGIRVEVPKNAKPGDVIRMDVLKKRKPRWFFKKGKTLGGIAIEIKVG